MSTPSLRPSLDGVAPLDFSRGSAAQSCLWQFNAVIRQVNVMIQEHGRTGEKDLPIEDWNFKERTTELYKAMARNLNTDCFTAFKDPEEMNGFEVYRQIMRTKDPLRKNLDFHLESAISQMAAFK